MLINNIRGKFVKKGSFEPVGVCDRSGFWFSKSDLVKEYIWSGDKLVWNGLIVGRPFLDKPNEQLRTPVLKDDPKPVKEPRPAPYDPPGIDAPFNEARSEELQEVDFTENEVIDPNIHNIMGYDSSNITPDQRIAILNKINFNQ